MTLPLFPLDRNLAIKKKLLIVFFFVSQQGEMDRDEKASSEVTWAQCDLTKWPGLLYRRKDR